MELRTDRYKLKEVFPDRAKKYAQKLHVKADEIEYVRKGIPIDPVDISIEEGERAAIRLITTPRLDRDGEILIPDGAILDDFRQSPSVLFGHKYDTLPIGKDIWIKQSPKGILAKTIYANHQFAEDAFQCVKGGFMNSNSVGFIPIERITQGDARFKDIVNRLEKDYGVPRDEANEAKAIYTKWLLLEHSDVPVASNAQSLNIAVSKGELVLNSKTFKDELGVTDPEPVSEPVPDAHTTVCNKDTDLLITDSAVQPKIDFCDACGTPKGVEVPISEPMPELMERIGIGSAVPESEPEAKAEPTTPAPDVAAELASLRADVAAVLAMLQAGKVAEPDIEAEAVPAADDIAFEPSVIPTPEDITIEPDKSIQERVDERIDNLIQSPEHKRIVKEAVEVALAKLTGKVI